MRIRTIIFAACFSLTAIAQTTPKPTDNTQVCHLPNATKASTKPATLMEGYGKAHMSVTTKSAEAQAFFDQGLALMHSFWFYEADRSFERAAQLDPECAMAQWGIAMSDINEERRNAAIKRAKELAPKVSEREQLYLVAVEARYAGEKSAVQNNGFLGVAPIELKARLAAYENKADDAIKLLRDALEEELKLGYSEPSLYPQPMEEVAGKVCLELKRWKEAEEFFRAALERDPGSGRAYFGLMQAQQNSGKQTEARETYTKFIKAWKQADEDLPEMKMAKEKAAEYRVASNVK